MESLICTVYNEEETIKSLLDSILRQTHLPDEVIFVDAQSTDSTFAMLQSYATHFKQKKVQYKLFQLSGNRSKGRNYAIEQAKGDIILVTDAGCVLDTNWVRNLIKAFTKGVSVVSGYYLPTAPPLKNKRDPIKKDSIFQRSLAAYTSTMPDILAKLGSSNFLPSSRSIAFKKSAWAEVKGYPENLRTSEDLTFARNLKENGAVFALAAEAVVYWPQKSSFIQAFKQFFNYAFGDGQAFYFRQTTPYLYGRYVFGIALLILSVIFHAPLIAAICIGLICAYILWSIHKNYQYVAHWQAFFILPALQIISDIAVLSGMTLGIITHPVLKNTSLQLFGRLLTAGIGLLTTAMLARYLGPRSFGEYSFIFSISTAVFLLVLL
jgi:glycosyltransferase involved in cell wall biosynthesis